jgi:allantoinase
MSGDWNNDDQPYPMKVKSGKMFAIPYCAEINDIPLYMRKGYTGEQYERSVLDQFDALHADSRKQPRVMGVPLHPMISGQPLQSSRPPRRGCRGCCRSRRVACIPALRQRLRIETLC